MARVKSPLMSQGAQKQLGHELIFKMKNNRAFVTGYSRPGRKNPFTKSADQNIRREFYTTTVAAWQAKTQEQKDVWNDRAKEEDLNMSGWNLYYKTEFDAQFFGIGYAEYGTRIYGYYEYGYMP